MYCCEKLYNNRIKFDFYTTLLRLHTTVYKFVRFLNFMWYYFLPLWESFGTTRLKSGLCYKITFSNISNLTFVQVLINLLMYYHALLLNMLQHDFYPY